MSPPSFYALIGHDSLPINCHLCCHYRSISHMSAIFFYILDTDRWWAHRIIVRNIIKERMRHHHNIRDLMQISKSKSKLCYRFKRLHAFPIVTGVEAIRVKRNFFGLFLSIPKSIHFSWPELTYELSSAALLVMFTKVFLDCFARNQPNSVQFFLTVLYIVCLSIACHGTVQFLGMCPLPLQSQGFNGIILTNAGSLCQSQVDL